MKKLVLPIALTILASCNPNIDKFYSTQNKINWSTEIVDSKEIDLDYEMNHLLHIKPWLTLWSEVYKQSEDNIVFFNRAGKGFEIAQIVYFSLFFYFIFNAFSFISG